MSTSYVEPKQGTRKRVRTAITDVDQLGNYTGLLTEELKTPMTEKTEKYGRF